jgi:hypothetical protein
VDVIVVSRCDGPRYASFSSVSTCVFRYTPYIDLFAVDMSGSYRTGWKLSKYRACTVPIVLSALILSVYALTLYVDPSGGRILPLKTDRSSNYLRDTLSSTPLSDLNVEICALLLANNCSSTISLMIATPLALCTRWDTSIQIIRPCSSQSDQYQFNQ